VGPEAHLADGRKATTHTRNESLYWPSLTVHLYAYNANRKRSYIYIRWSTYNENSNSRWMNYVRKVRRGDCRRFLLLNIRLKYINTQFVTLWHQTYRRSKCAISTKFQLRVIRWVHKLFKWPLLLCHPKKGSFKMTITQTLMTVRGMKITPLLCYPTITTWHNSHHLPLHNSSALSPVHELFKRPL